MTDRKRRIRKTGIKGCEIYTHKDLETHQTTEHVFPMNEYARAKIKEEYLIRHKREKKGGNRYE